MLRAMYPSGIWIFSTYKHLSSWTPSSSKVGQQPAKRGGSRNTPSDEHEGSHYSQVLLFKPLYNPWNSLGQHTGVGSLSLLQGIFLTQGLNPGLPHHTWILYQLSHKGKPKNTGVGSLSLLPQIFPIRNQTGVSCIAGGTL